MRNKSVALILVVIALVNLFLLSWFSVFNAVISTIIGLFFSFPWFFIVGKVLEDKYTIDSVERKISIKESLILIAPGLIYYLTVCAVAVSVYVFA